MFGGGSVLAVALSVCASSAFAATSTAVSTTDATAPGVVSELTVVAEKREENIETVPVAITAFGAKQRDIIGIKSVQDLSDFTPGLSYFSIGDQAFIRGIGRNTTNLATASGVATYYDGIYYGANATIALAHDSLFISNIEVDRGPQNTLHGSNADGGTLNYISQRPTHSLYAEMRGGAQNFGYNWGEGVISGPINDNLRFRVGANYSGQGLGYFKNYDGKPEGGSLPQGNGGSSRYVEASFDTNIGKLDGWGKVSSGDYDTNFHTVATVGNIPEYEFGSFNLSNLAPNPFFGLCALDGNTGVGCTASGQTVISATGAPVVANQFQGNNPSNINPHLFIETGSQHNTQSHDLAFATTWTYHFDGIDLTYTGGYQRFYYNLAFSPGYDAGLTSYQIAGPAVANAACTGAGFTAAQCTAPLTINPVNDHLDFIEQDQYYSNELTLSSTGSAPLQWLAGAYQYHEHFDQPIGLGCDPQQQQIIHPATLAGTAAPLNANACTINVDGNMQYDDYAGYGQISYKFNDQWKFLGGVRYTYDHKYGFEQQRLVAFDESFGFLPDATTFGSVTPAVDVTGVFDAGSIGKSVPGSGVATLNAATGYIVRPLAGSWSAFTGDATLDWTPDPDTLAYLRYSRGYKAGGFNAGSIGPQPETQPESVDDFELGLKKTFGGNFTLNGDFFYYNWENDQQPFSVAQNGAFLSEIFNIPVAHLYGVELEAVWRPIDDLTVIANYAYLNGKVADMKGNCVADSQNPLAQTIGGVTPNTTGCVPGSGGQNLTGAVLPETPPNKVTLNAQYATHFDMGTFTASGTFVWKDSTYGEIFNNSLTRAPSYETVNIRGTFDDIKGRYTVILFVNNLFDTVGYDRVTEANLAASGAPLAESTGKGLTAPRTYGIELQYRFK
ncbi:MAG TPA: TonB-dependent receptor [Caulobacteraceae bacterium]